MKWYPDYCVVYLVCGVHYRYRCKARNKQNARKMCKETIGIEYKDIVEVYREDKED